VCVDVGLLCSAGVRDERFVDHVDCVHKMEVVRVVLSVSFVWWWW
jgi:hypothetical protein